MYVLLEFWQKNHGNPFYEPTITVHDMGNSYYRGSCYGNRIFKYIILCESLDPTAAIQRLLML